MTASKRLLSLDIMRGITIAGMILVNNAGSWSRAYAPLCHAEWTGLTPTDLVFPFFMFIMGVSTYMSLRKYDFRPSGSVLAHLVRRTVVIFAIGLLLTWFGSMMYGWLAGGKEWTEAASLENLRLLGVLQRLALSYGLGATIALVAGRRSIAWIAAGLLVIYAVILTVGHGYDYSDDNIVARFDRAVLSPGHMYVDYAFDTPLCFDPEGLLATLPSVAHVLIGFLCGAMICGATDNMRRMNRLFILGTVLTFIGLLLSYALPISKKLWSPTFVLTCCGLSALLLALLIWILDVKRWTAWSRFFQAFGLNPLYLYIQSMILAVIFGAVQVPYDAVPGGMTSLKGVFYFSVLDPLTGHDPQLASCIWAILFVLLNWIPGYLLQRYRILIKV
ncbi:MAG: DUF5009 domain-containing protein [Clostridiales bacterium]|nr:DUF5009 domain-containing protein [Clostridiales bacterium]